MNIYCFSTLSFAKLQFKSVINKAFHKHGVASFTDAWIETEGDVKSERVVIVASFTDAWIETSGDKKLTGTPSRIFYRCVDWNKGMAEIAKPTARRIFYRCVDWNR